jgi:hypothetical protein
MGEKKNRLERFKLAYPNCCFCGGGRLTETVEHAPPRVFFRDKHRPKGLEFPACRRCNEGSSQLDQVASFVALVASDATRRRVKEEYIGKLLQGIRNNTPEIIQYFGPKAKRIYLNSRGVLQPMVKVPTDRRLFDDWLDPWAAKIACALWYHHTRNILSEEQRIHISWLTNAYLIEHGVPEQLIGIEGRVNWLYQGKVCTSDQFHYKFRVDDDARIGYFLLALHESAIALAVVVDPQGVDKLGWSSSPLFQTSAETGLIRMDHDRALLAG